MIWVAKGKNADGKRATVNTTGPTTEAAARHAIACSRPGFKITSIKQVEPGELPTTTGWAPIEEAEADGATD